MEQNKQQITNWADLFSLYRDLVGPFQKFENLSFHQRELERKLEWETKCAQENISFNVKDTIKNIFWDTLKWAIPFLVVFWPIMTVTQLENIYSDLVSAIYKQLIGNGGFLIDALYYLGLTIILAPCLILLFPFMIVHNVVSENRRISQRKKKNEETLKACEKARKEQLPQLEAAKQEALKRIAPFFNYIPPDYRNSHALNFFSNSFFNAKVKNLQEAVNLYDQYLHQQEMEERQREIMREAQRASMDAVDALSRQMAYMQDQIQDQIDSLYYHYQ